MPFPEALSITFPSRLRILGSTDREKGKIQHMATHWGIEQEADLRPPTSGIRLRAYLGSQGMYRDVGNTYIRESRGLYRFFVQYIEAEHVFLWITLTNFRMLRILTQSMCTWWLMLFKTCQALAFSIACWSSKNKKKVLPL